MSNDNEDLSGKLTFENDKGAGRSRWLAVFLALVLAGWMGSGYIIKPTSESAEEEDTSVQLVAVAVVDSSAQDIDLILTAEGQSTPDRSTSIQAKTTGQVIAVSVQRGDLVSSGEEIGRLDAKTSDALLVQAKAQLEQTSQDLERLTNLLAGGVTTENQVMQSRSANAAAEAAVIEAQKQVENSVIRAPFSGRLNDMTLDEGEFVNDGDIVAEVLDNDPLTVVAQVPQQALSRLKKGQVATVSFITGEIRDGIVGFIGSNADSQTRTFRVEINVPNPASVMPAGLSAQVAIPTGRARGHFISPAILSLGPAGELGVKVVADRDAVSFVPVSIVRAQTDGIWVTGLGANVRIITIGQGFVNAGDVVDPRTDGAQDEQVAKQ